MPKASRGWDNAKKVNGRKRHIAVDTTGLVLAVVVTAASVQDRDGARPLLWNLSRCCTRVRLAWADAAYTGKLTAWAAGLKSPAGRLSANTTRTPSRSCPAAGSSNAPWPGSPAAAAAPATTNGSPKPTRPWSCGP